MAGSLYAIRYGRNVGQQIAEIRAYIASEGAPRAAAALQARLLAAIDSLEHFPERGRPIGSNSRELTTVPPYIIRYRVIGRVVRVTRIRHAARRPD